MQPRVLLGAIAKDEGAYLPQWIYHHLSIGVDEVRVLINGTTDQSLAILDKISAHYPCSFRVCDDLLSTKSGPVDSYATKNYLSYNPLQSRAYCELLEYALEHDFSHILLMDIDELLITADKTIQQLLERYPDQVIRFQWANQVSDDQEFSIGLSETITFRQPRFFKSLTPIRNTEIKFLNEHETRTRPEAAYVMSKDNYILHRWQRSEMEYISLLLRGDTYKNGLGSLKANRPGRITNFTHQVFLSEESVSAYDKKLRRFIDECQIDRELMQAQNFIRARHSAACEVIEQQNIVIENYLRGLRETDRMPSLIKFLSLPKQKLILQSAEALVDVNQGLCIELCNQILNESEDKYILSTTKKLRKRAELMAS